MDAYRRFQSTLPLRGATIRLELSNGLTVISIHAPLTGSDGSLHQRIRRSRRFQSTLPLRGATRGEVETSERVGISIHAPLTGSDLLIWTFRTWGNNFNPRSPYGERLSSFPHGQRGKDFNPRSPYGERQTYFLLP